MREIENRTSHSIQSLGGMDDLLSPRHSEYAITAEMSLILQHLSSLLRNYFVFDSQFKKAYFDLLNFLICFPKCMICGFLFSSQRKS